MTVPFGAAIDGAVKRLRSLFLRHRTVAMTVIFLALAMKVLVPAGFMPEARGKVLTIVMCDGTGQSVASKMVLPTPGKSAGDPVIKHDGTCPWGGLSHDALSTTEAFLAAILLVWIMAQVFRPATRPVLRGIAHLRPPLRGPPAFA